MRSAGVLLTAVVLIQSAAPPAGAGVFVGDRLIVVGGAAPWCSGAGGSRFCVPVLGRSGGLVMEERDASASTGGSDPSGKLRFAVTPEQMGWIERESKARGVDRSDLIREVFARGMGETSSNGSGVAAPPYGGAGSASEAADAPGVVGLPSVHPSPASPPASLPVRSAVVAAEAGGASRAVSDREVLASPPPAPAGVGAAAVAAGGAPGALPDREVSASPPRASAGTGAAAAAAGVVDAADDPSVEAGPPSSFVAVPPEAAARPGAKASAESALAALVASGNSAGLPVIGGLGGPGGIVPGRGLVVLVSDRERPVLAGHRLVGSLPARSAVGVRVVLRCAAGVPVGGRGDRRRVASVRRGVRVDGGRVVAVPVPRGRGVARGGRSTTRWTAGPAA